MTHGFGHKFGIITKDQELVPPQYDQIDRFSDGIAGYRVGYLYGFLDKNGKEITPPQFGLLWTCKEGLARELVNRLQNLRKDQGLAVTDKIKIELASGQSFVQEAVQQHNAYICHETQALQLAIVDKVAKGVSLNLDGYTTHVSIALVS